MQNSDTLVEKPDGYLPRGALATVHQGFDFVCFNRDVRHQIPLSGFSDENGVFESNAEAFFFDVNSGLAREHPTGSNFEVIVRHVMDVESDRMRDAVHEVRSHRRLVGRGFFELRGFNEPEVHAFFGEQLFAFGA